ncbi:MAG: glycoside hydrolase family 3 N-terminal domain-containing protein [Phycisphaerae bacterium]
MVNTAALLAQMTLEEKLAQLNCIYLGKTPRGDFATLTEVELKEKFGLGMGQVCQPGKRRAPAEIVAFVNLIQKFLLTQTRLKIPALMHEEGLHGMIANGVTALPVPLAMAASWNPSLVQQCLDKVGRELRSVGIHQALSPVLDVAREPRWGRMEETFGEDPHLVARMGVAAVQGFQGGAATIDAAHVIATGKHFCGYAESENGTNVGPYCRDLRTLYEVHFRPFAAAIKEAHLRGIMASYNDIAGVPSHGNRWLLQTILRDRMGFKGIVVADYGGVRELATLHHLAENDHDAGVLAFQAGVDYDLPNNSGYKLLTEDLRSGRLSIAQLDTMVLRILDLKRELGLFENPYAQEAIALAEVGNTAGNKLAVDIAREAIVLLKNDGAVLPLNRAALVGKTVAVIGPNAAVNHLGAYYGSPKYSIAPFDGIQTLLGTATKVVHAEGCRITMTEKEMAHELNLEDPDKDHNVSVTSTPQTDAALIAQAVATAQNADVIILCLGGNLATSRESFYDSPSGDRADLTLLGGQRALFDAVRAACPNKPIVVVVVHGGAVADEHLFTHAPAIVDATYLGQEAGTAIAEVLFGVTNPSGKLPFSVPRSAGHLPVFYNHKFAARRKYGFTEISPAFAFGYGLSYTRFTLTAPQLAVPVISSTGTTTVTVRLTNIGPCAGAEVVQFYLRDEVASFTRPVQELRHFEKVWLQPGESRDVIWTVTPADLELLDENFNPVVEPGTFRIGAGTSARMEDQQFVTLTVRG